jgi:hypothetical protein
MYGLPQTGRLSQQRLITNLRRFGYIQCANTPCLFRHESKDITFCLVVDDFGCSFANNEDFDHLVHALESCEYKLSIKLDGDT